LHFDCHSRRESASALTSFVVILELHLGLAQGFSPAKKIHKKKGL
jgi:hypothetical protein